MTTVAFAAFCRPAMAARPLGGMIMRVEVYDALMARHASRRSILRGLASTAAVAVMGPAVMAA
jgi:hypothetical protein